jgi:DNA excision repair protein ERCC-4
MTTAAARSHSRSEEKLVVVVDTREQEPYAFGPEHVTTVRRALVAGDYSLEGHEEAIAVERKSVDDYVASVVSAKERFGRELDVLGSYDLACVVVEATLEDISEHRYRAGVHPNAVLGATLSIIVDRGVPVYFCGDRQLACRFVEGLLRRYHRKLGGT